MGGPAVADGKLDHLARAREDRNGDGMTDAGHAGPCDPRLLLRRFNRHSGSSPTAVRIGYHSIPQRWPCATRW